MRLIFRILALTGFLFTAAVLLAIAAVGYLLVDGGTRPPGCAKAATGGFEQAARSLTFDAKLAAFVAAGGRFPLSSVSIDEAEASARAASYFTEHTERISNVAVCFDGGEAEGFMLVETVFGRKIGVRGAGQLDLSGRHPTLQLGRAEVAGIALPGFARRRIAESVNAQLTGIELVFPLSLHLDTDVAVLSPLR